MKNMKQIVSLALTIAMLVTSLIITGISAAAAGTINAAGWFETITATISGVTDSQVTSVSYSGPTSGSLTGQDLQYLVRDENGSVRIDIPGLKAGTYNLTVVAGGSTYTENNIEVLPYDRSGYAHFNYTAGVGAYNDDGTLKSNAIVLYVTNDNKNSVTVTSKDGTTVTGIGNILGSTGMDVGTGLNAKGGKANTNQDILRKLAKDGTPLVVRIIGNVKGSDMAGLTAYDSIDYGGTVGDNGFMARMSGGKDITIEGIGYDATIDGWGLHFICQTADYAAGYGKSFEVRNITFENVPEDCVGMEGQQEDSTLTAPVERGWIHHCSFMAPIISNPAESDKDGGDGACDFKRGQYFTNSYCYYDGYHKTNLVGSSDSSLQYHLTYHHNYWLNCESRGPLARQANIHMYNNIFEGQTSYCMNPRANAYIFSEYNMFLKCKNPATLDSGGVVKSYNDSFASCLGDNDAITVTDRATTVSTSNKYANFDTNSTLSYIPSGNYQIQESITEMKAVVMAYAGVQKKTIISSDEVDSSVIPESRLPKNAVVLPYNKSLNSSTVTSTSGTFDNIVFNVKKTDGSAVTIGGTTSDADIVFYVDCTVNISMTEVSGTYSPVLCNEAGEEIITGTGSAAKLPAGYYFIQSSGYDVGAAKYKEAKISALSIEAAIVCNNHTYNTVVTQPSCTKGGYTTFTCTNCGYSYVGNDTAAIGHTPGAAATCTTPQTCTTCSAVLNNTTSHSYVGGTCSTCGKADPSTCTHTNCTSVVTQPTCTTKGYTTYTCSDCTYSYTGNEVAANGHNPGAAADCTAPQTCTVCHNVVTPALGHNYSDGSCTRCGAQDLAVNSHSHSFGDGLPASGSFFTATGSFSNTEVTIDGKVISKGLKMQSSAGVISFTAPADGTFTIYTNPAKGSGNTIKINGEKYATKIDSNGVLEIAVTQNTSYEITKGDGESHIYYIVYTPASSGGSGGGGDVHSHSYTAEVTTAATCTTPGVKTYTCSCGSFYTEPISATGHSYQDGNCKNCGADDPNYNPDDDENGGGGNTGSGDNGSGSPTVNGPTSGKYTFTASADVVAGTDGDPITSGTTYSNGFFTVNGTAKMLIDSETGLVKSIELGKAAGGAIVFTVGADTVLILEVSSTGNSNTSGFAIVDANGNVVANKEGASEIYGSMAAKQKFTYELSAGTYKIVSPAGTSYSNRGVRVYSIEAVIGGDDTHVGGNVPHTHSYTSSVTSTPDCTKNGSITHTCTCGHSYTEEIEATGHSYENGVCTDCEAVDPNHNPGGDNTGDNTPGGDNTGDNTPDTNPGDDNTDDSTDDGADNDNEKPARKTFWQKIADFFRAIGRFFVRLFTGKKD